MTEKRDWSVTASANTGSAANGFFAEGMAYSAVNDAARETQAIIARHLADTNGSIVSTGSTSSYILAINQTLTSYKEGDIFSFYAHAKNDGATTVRVRTPDGASLSDRPVVKTDLSALSDGDIVAGGTYFLYYKSASANFQVVNVSAFSTADSLGLRGDLSVSGAVSVGGLSDLQGADIHGDVSVSGALSVSQGLDVHGDVSISGALSVASTQIQPPITKYWAGPGTVDTTSTSFTDITGLTGWTIDAATFYKIEAFIRSDMASGTDDAEWKITLDQTPNRFSVSVLEINTASDTLDADSFTLISDASAYSPGSDAHYFVVRGVVEGNSSLSSTLDFQFRNAQTGTDTVRILAGSWATITKL